jgi:ribose transport system substrate-binding protein
MTEEQHELGGDEGRGETNVEVNRRRFLVTGATAAAGVVLLGCGSSSSTKTAAGSGAKTAAAKQISKIGFDHPNNQIPFWSDIMHWSKAEAKDKNIELLLTADNAKLDLQVANLNSWVQQKVPAIICYPLEPSTIETIAAKAQAAGIVWVSYSADLKNQDGSVQLNNKESGRQLGEEAAKFINEKLGGKANVLHLTFPDGGTLGRDRDQGVLEGLKKAPGAKVVASQQAVDQQAGLKVTGATLSAHPDLNVVIGINDDGALGAFQAFRDRGHAANDPKVWIGGQDGAKAALEAIKKGTMYRASVALSLRELGAECVNLPLGIARGEIPKGTNKNVPVHLLTASDAAKIDEFLGELNY